MQSQRSLLEGVSRSSVGTHRVWLTLLDRGEVPNRPSAEAIHGVANEREAGGFGVKPVMISEQFRGFSIDRIDSPVLQPQSAPIEAAYVFFTQPAYPTTARFLLQRQRNLPAVLRWHVTQVFKSLYTDPSRQARVTQGMCLTCDTLAMRRVSVHAAATW